jgi:hypothetical protein
MWTAGHAEFRTAVLEIAGGEEIGLDSPKCCPPTICMAILGRQVILDETQRNNVHCTSYSAT